MEGSLQGGVWSWHSWGFVLSRTGEVLVCFSLVLSDMFLLHWYLINLNNFVLHLARSALEDGDICVVAKLLSDIMAYRASGTGHLELIAGWFYNITFSIKARLCLILVNTCGFICGVTLWFHESWYYYLAWHHYCLALLSLTKMFFVRIFTVAEVQAIDSYFKRTSGGSSWSNPRGYSISPICWSYIYSYSFHPLLGSIPMFSVT